MRYEELEKQMESQTWREDNQIDENDLITEWKKTMIMYEKWSRRVGRAQKNLSKQAFQIKVKESEVKMDVRENPENYGWTPKPRAQDPTEDFVKSCIYLSKELQEMNQTMFQLQNDLDDLIAARDSIQWLRREAVKDMVKMFLSGSSLQTGNSELSEIKDRVLREIQARELDEQTQVVMKREGVEE